MTLTKAYYKMGEVSEILGIPATTLRFWEKEFSQLRPPRLPSGQRRYRPEDIELCRKIQHLLRDKGLSIEYTRKELSLLRKSPPRHPFVCGSVDDAMRLLAEVRRRSDDPHTEARLRAIEKWIGTL